MSGPSKPTQRTRPVNVAARGGAGRRSRRRPPLLALVLNQIKQPYIGGQAVIEGVMMRAPSGMSVAVRRPDGSIAIKEGPFTSRLARSKLWKLLGFRGIATLVESVALGYRALSFSAEQQMTEEERAEAASASSTLPILIATAVAIGLFIALPQALATWLTSAFGWHIGLSDPTFHLIIGGFKLLVFVAYLLLIRRLKDTRRVFEYHGAEHKTLHAYERDLPLTVDNVRVQSTLHPRCGTTFLIVVIAVSIVAGAVAAPLLLPNASGWTGQLAIFVLRLALLPLIAAIAFEFQRFTARYCTHGLARVVLWPGFLFQMITTIEPDDSQMEIAIAAMEAAAWRERVGDEVPGGDEPLVFPSLEGLNEALPELRPAPAAA